MTKQAILALANGEVFSGVGFGFEGSSVGEVVFNTAITGYQEILTDPSYAEQIVTLTHPHIGNTGVNSEDDESDRIWATGLIIRDLPVLASSWRKQESLDDYLTRHQTSAIAEVDTRRLTGILRDQGSQNGCIVSSGSIDANTIEEALKRAREFPGLKGMDLAKVVTTPDSYGWEEQSWQLGKGHTKGENLDFHVVAYDFGTKRNILRMLVDRGCRLTVVPATTPAREVVRIAPDGVFLSNGPGDPDPCDYAIAAVKELLNTDLPIFGICLGCQILALASGSATRKMGHGHHGANHPVQDLATEEVLITSQNHGFCIDEETLATTLKVTHRSLFDGTIQGVHRTDRPAFGFQGHPEASPGPHDSAPLFDHFVELIEHYRRSKA